MTTSDLTKKQLATILSALDDAPRSPANKGEALRAIGRSAQRFGLTTEDVLAAAPGLLDGRLTPADFRVELHDLGGTPVPALGRLMPPAIAIALEQAHADHLVDDAGQLAASLAALHLGLPLLAIELVDHPLEDADEDHGFAWCVLEMLEQRDHFAAKQAVGAADIGLAALLAEGFRPGLGPGHALAGEVRDAVDEDEVLRRDQPGQLGVALSDMLIVTRREERARVGGGVDTTDQAGNVDGIRPGPDRDASPGQPCTDFMPASRSTQSVVSGGSLQSSEVLPTPDGPKIAIVVLLLASARRWSAVMIARDMGGSPAGYAAASMAGEAMRAG